MPVSLAEGGRRKKKKKKTIPTQQNSSGRSSLSTSRRTLTSHHGADAQDDMTAGPGNDLAEQHWQSDTDHLEFFLMPQEKQSSSKGVAGHSHPWTIAKQVGLTLCAWREKTAFSRIRTCEGEAQQISSLSR